MKLNRFAASLTSSLTSSLAALILLGASGARAQDVEIGYRFLDVTGNTDMYRSQINERPGLILRSLTWNGEGLGTSRLFDQVRIDASDLGAGPAGSFRLTAGLTGAYRFDLSYRRTEHFSAEPAFANPFYAQGIVPGQHRMDRVRNNDDLEHTLRPGGMISPFVGYSRNRYEGPGSTTYHVGQDEFILGQNLFATDQEFHVGADFSAGFVSGRISQGWRKLHETENDTLVPGAGAGNNGGPVLGQDVSLTSLLRSGTTDSNTPVTTALVTVAPIKRVKLVGSYVRAKAETEDASQEDLSGNLVSFALSRFFKGLSEGTTGDAQNKMWRGSGRVEVNLFEGIDLTAGYSQRHRELSGLELISSLYLGTTTFAGLDLKDITQIVNTHTTLERTEKVLETRLSAKAFGPLSAFVGFSREKQDLTVTEDPAEIVVPGSQGGDFTRKVDRFDAGLNFRMAGAFLGADYQRARADNAVVRVDFRSQDRYRLRGGYGFADLVKLSLSAEQIDTKNDSPGIDRSGRMRQYGGDLTVTPAKTFFLRVSAFRFQNDNSMTIRQPQNFDLIPSLYAETANSFEIGAGFTLAPIALEASFGRIQNHGDLPFVITRTRVGAEFTFTSHVALVADWAQDKYEESEGLHLGDYDANRYGIFLRFHP